MEYPRAYVRRIVVNLALAEGTQRSRTGSAFDRVHEDSSTNGRGACSEAALLAIDSRSELDGMLATLPLRQRTVLVLRYFNDLSDDEIAELLKWPIGTVKSTGARAIDRLQQNFGGNSNLDGHGPSENRRKGNHVITD